MFMYLRAEYVFLSVQVFDDESLTAVELQLKPGSELRLTGSLVLVRFELTDLLFSLLIIVHHLHVFSQHFICDTMILFQNC